MKNNIIFILSVIGLLIFGDFPSAEAASLPSSPPPFYPPTITAPQPISPPANPPFVPSKPVIPSRNAPESGVMNPRTGEFFPGTFGGITNPRTGVFLPKVEGGYLNPETGEVIPKQ